jgi:hypothetical protein
MLKLQEAEKQAQEKQNGYSKAKSAAVAGSDSLN